MGIPEHINLFQVALAWEWLIVSRFVEILWAFRMVPYCWAIQEVYGNLLRDY
jgi:hypothetical protein